MTHALRLSKLDAIGEARNMSLNLQFLGATETVTGSRFLITNNEEAVLVDCGLFQGVRDIRKKNSEPVPIAPKKISAVLLTHAHLDHCGYLPALVKDGFSGPVYVTKYGAKLAAVVLHDSAHIHEEDAKFGEEAPLYNSGDVERTIGLFKIVNFRESFKVTENISATYFPSGHILGSAFLEVKSDGKSLLFTSDMGRENHPLLSPTDNPPGSDIAALITESTYGNRVHENDISEFATEINNGIKRGGSILIPAFAIDRTEVILMALRDLIENKQIPAIPIYVDSPMAIAALNLYRQAIIENAPEIRAGISAKWQGEDPFNAGGLVQALAVEQSKLLPIEDEPSIIISASGMATGGRVVHHLKDMLGDEKNTVILVGFQALGSRGRMLEDGINRIRIFGDWINVKAHISKIESFSVHADRDELVKWFKKCGAVNQVFIVHGEQESQVALRDALAKEFNWSAAIPKTLDRYSI